jgi:superfamily II helicase
MNKLNDIIIINVSGKIFKTTKTTLNKSDYFKTLLKYNNENQEIFLDRPILGFKHILSLLQDDQYPFPNEFIYELSYYQINSKLIQLDEKEKKIDLIETKLIELGKKISCNKPTRSCHWRDCINPTDHPYVNYCYVHLCGKCGNNSIEEESNLCYGCNL